MVAALVAAKSPREIEEEGVGEHGRAQVHDQKHTAARREGNVGDHAFPQEPDNGRDGPHLPQGRGEDPQASREEARRADLGPEAQRRGQGALPSCNTRRGRPSWARPRPRIRRPRAQSRPRHYRPWCRCWERRRRRSSSSRTGDPRPRADLSACRTAPTAPPQSGRTAPERGCCAPDWRRSSRRARLSAWG